MRKPPQWIETIHHHHSLEETMLFPDFERVLNAPGLMDTNIEQHAAFEKGLKIFADWVDETAKEPGRYSGSRAVELVDGFAPALSIHLTAEVDSLLELVKYDPDGSKTTKCFRELEKIAMGDVDKVSSGVFILLCPFFHGPGRYNGGCFGQG